MMRMAHRQDALPSYPQPMQAPQTMPMGTMVPPTQSAALDPEMNELLSGLEGL